MSKLDAFFLSALLILPSFGWSAESHPNDGFFKHIGGLARLEENCLNSQTLNSLVRKKFDASESETLVSTKSISKAKSDYDDGYRAAALGNVLWSLDGQVFSNPFSCNRAEDLNTVRCLLSKFARLFEY